MSASRQVKSIDRLVRVLDCFSEDQPAWSLADLATRLDVPKSTLHRFLVGLESHDILRREGSEKKWRLGYQLLVWASAAAGSARLPEIAKPVMRELVQATGETAILTVYHDGEVICIDKSESSQPVSLRLEVGKQRAIHAGASSKVLMAYLPPEQVRAIVKERGLPRLCTNTITRLKDLEAELTRIRQQGYAESLEETDQGAWGVATPIRDCSGNVVLAIGVAGPTTRYSKDKVHQYVLQCTQAAAKISAVLDTDRN
ncbi:MAG: IclR family transcriptional regulator [Chloroflexi bacterium]|nr:IclR family transcriptional regulator [Chloroflexota bacterium]